MALSSVLYECSFAAQRCPLDTSICFGHQQNTKRRVRQLSLLPVFHRDNIDLLMRKVVRTVYFISKIHTSANIRPQNKATLLTTLGWLRHSLAMGNLKCDRHGGWAHLHACVVGKGRLGVIHQIWGQV